MVHDPIRILIVDDSRIFRGVLESVLAGIPDVVVVGSVFNGDKALEFIQSNRVDLATLDIEMPGKNGIETLRAIRELNRKRPTNSQTETLLVSSLTTQGARCTVEGLQLGAIDFVLKPSGGTEAENLAVLQKTMLEKLAIYRQKSLGIRETATRLTTPPRPSIHAGSYRAIAIGISTGGPETLAKLLPDLAGKTVVPIFIIQHIQHGMSRYLSESLSKKVGYPIVEAQQGTVVMSGGIYMAQSGSHMILRHLAGQISIGLSNAPAENHSRPSVDVFLRSAAAVYGPSLIAAIMTGMLNDGASGVRVVKRAGGVVLAQDQASSVIWGMPRAAIETGAVDFVLPLEKIAPAFLSLIQGAIPK
ncbi:MAG: chemotaxis-specific protein-glutamate methyltransferase CheB [Pirellula sp.]